MQYYIHAVSLKKHQLIILVTNLQSQKSSGTNPHLAQHLTFPFFPPPAELLEVMAPLGWVSLCLPCPHPHKAPPTPSTQEELMRAPLSTLAPSPPTRQVRHSLPPPRLQLPLITCSEKVIVITTIIPVTVLGEQFILLS